MFRGWALNRAGVERIELVVDGRRRFPAQLGIGRDDVASAHPGYPNSATAGFEVALDLDQLSVGHHDIDVVVTDSTGATTKLGRKTYLPEAFRRTWAALLSARGRRLNDTFYFVFATSNVREYGGAGIDNEYNPYLSETVRVGARVPILYLRTTRGSAHDWVFDEEFDTSIKCGTRHIAEDSLNAVMRWSIAQQVPVLFTLNGGIWADSSCNVPEWDVNDHLEEDVANCQWNERNEVMPDDYLRNLPGSQEAPELARTLTLNVHATAVRTYKKRNLQHAARLIREFAGRNPHLFIGVSLDPDVTINPFFEGNQWYDYNPGTLRQFREWLRGTGPYAKNRPDGEADLHGYRRLKPFTLAEINRIAARHAYSSATTARCARRGTRSGNSSGAIWWMCTTTTCRAGSAKWASIAIASSRRKGSMRRAASSATNRSRCISRAARRVMTRAACRCRARCPRMAIWAPFCTATARKT